jgi:hypothetical protein
VNTKKESVLPKIENRIRSAKREPEDKPEKSESFKLPEIHSNRSLAISTISFILR